MFRKSQYFARRPPKNDRAVDYQTPIPDNDTVDEDSGEILRDVVLNLVGSLLLCVLAIGGYLLYTYLKS